MMPEKKLYDLATQFRKTSLWTRLADDELFAVRLPGGEIVYCCVMGWLGLNLGLAVYPGTRGLDTLRAIVTVPVGETPIARHERILCQDCVQCSFEAKDGLEPPDLAEIRRHGLALRGKNAFPVFRRMRPFTYPWKLAEEDEQIIAAGLTAGLEVAKKLNGGASKEALGFTDGPPFSRSIPLLTPQSDGSFSWASHELPAEKTSYPSPRIADELQLARARKAPPAGSAWSVIRFLSPEPVVADETLGKDGLPLATPSFPFVLLTLDNASEYILDVHMLPQGEDTPALLAARLLDRMVEIGRPARVLVPDERTHALLATALAQVGIPVELSENLPRLAEAAEDLFDTLAQGNPPDVEEAFAENMERLEALEREGLLPRELRETANHMREIGRQVSQASKRSAGSAPFPASSFVVSASLRTGCYRHIQISVGDTLWHLHAAILDAFGFEDDHLHAFFMNNRAWDDAAAFSSPRGDGPERRSDEYTLAAAGLRPEKKFVYIFDFGEEWRFQCRVLREVAEATDTPRVIRSVGEAPQQYWDDDREEEEGDEEDASPEIWDADRLRTAYAALALSEETVGQLHAYFDACANFYGLLPLAKVLEIYNQQNTPLTPEAFYAFAEIARHARHGFEILAADELYGDGPPVSPEAREIIAEYLLVVEEDVAEMRILQHGKPYYIPEREELLRYADGLYFEKTPAFLALRDYLRAQMRLSPKKADEIAEEMQIHAAMNESDMDYILGDAKRMGARFGKEAQVGGFMTRYIAMANETRMHIHRGHTPGEMAARTKTGRNAPCPCGSGKKYKHCCGREG